MSLRLLVVLLAALSSQPAAAFERTGSAVADALLRTLERSGYADVTVGEVSRADGDTVLEDVAAVTAADGRSLSIGRVVVADGLVNAANALVAESVLYEAVAAEAGDGGTSRAERIVIDGVTFPGEGGGNAGLAALLGSFDTLSIAGVEAVASGGDVVRVEAVSAAIEERELADAVGGRVAVTGLAFDVSLWEEPLAGRLGALGYDTLSFDLVAAGRWEAASGDATIRELRVSGEELGTLSLTAEAAGLTPAAFEAIRESLQNIPALIERLQSISVSALEVSYTDAGLAERLLERAEREGGASRTELVEGLAGAAGQLVGTLGNTAFAERVREQVASFLADPDTLTIAATPERPVTAAEVLAASVVRPELLPELLGLSISTGP